MNVSIIKRVEKLDYLIRIKCTGNPEQLATKLNISVRTLYTTIELLKNLGAPIAYCKDRQSYYYCEDGEFCMRFIKK